MKSVYWITPSPLRSIIAMTSFTSSKDGCFVGPYNNVSTDLISSGPTVPEWSVSCVLNSSRISASGSDCTVRDDTRG